MGRRRKWAGAIMMAKTFKTLTKVDGLPNNNLYPILEDKSGNIWFSSVGMGLYRYDGKAFTNFSE